MDVVKTLFGKDFEDADYKFDIFGKKYSMVYPIWPRSHFSIVKLNDITYHLQFNIS